MADEVHACELPEPGGWWRDAPVSPDGGADWTCPDCGRGWNVQAEFRWEPAPTIIREPFDPRHLFWTVTVQSTDLDNPPTTFGPFSSSDQARAFAYDHNFHAYTATVVYPPEDGDHLRIARGGAQ